MLGCDGAGTPGANDASIEPDGAASADAALGAEDADASAGDADAGAEDADAGAEDTDASAGVPLPGFGAITGACGAITPVELDGTSPRWFQGAFDFGTDRYDDPDDRPRLTPGGREILLDGNAGGSSLYSELFAYEWLARCELAVLLKTETEVAYDVNGKKADLLVEIDGRRVGVSVVRFVKYPFDSEYLLSDASPLVERKLRDLRLATTQVAAADRWTTQMVVAIAYAPAHAQVAMQAWSLLDAETRGATLFVVVVSEGDDRFIYTDQ